MFIIVLGKHVSTLIESSSGPAKKTNPQTDTSLYIYIRVKHFDQNSIPEEIKSRLRSGNACYHSVQNLLS